MHTLLKKQRRTHLRRSYTDVPVLADKQELTYNNSCADRRCNMEDFAGAMNDWDEWEDIYIYI